MPSTRRHFLLGSASLATAPLWSRRSAASAPAKTLYQRTLAIDGLTTLGSMLGEAGARLGDTDIRDIRASGLAALHLTVGLVGNRPEDSAFESVVRGIARWEREIDRHAASLTRVRVAADISKARAEGRTGLIYGLQDGVSFEGDLDRLDSLHQLGVRVVQPTYNRRNLLGDGCMEPSNAGLSRDGRAAIEKIDALGIMLDLSHCGRRTAADALALSKRPVSFTHTGCYALAEHPRHRTDAEMRRAADSGGVTGIFIMPYLSKGKQPTAADVVRHVVHALNVAGEDHVSIGTDGYLSATELTPAYAEAFGKSIRQRRESGIAAPFETEEGYLFAADLNSPRRFETLAAHLLDAGLTESQVEKVLGSNLMRVFAACW